jgi:hypothetical protein
LPNLKYSLRLLEIGELLKTIADEQEMLCLIAEYRAILPAMVDQGQALNATMAAQNQEIQDKLIEVLSAAKRQLPQVEAVDLPIVTSKRTSQTSGR